MYKLQHIGIRSSDLQKTADFYTKALGGTKKSELHRKETGSHLLFIEFDGFEIEFIHKKDQTPNPGTNHIALQVNDLDQALQKLQDYGLAIDKTAIKSFGQSRIYFFNGPDGEIIEFFEVK